MKKISLLIIIFIFNCSSESSGWDSKAGDEFEKNFMINCKDKVGDYDSINEEINKMLKNSKLTKPEREERYQKTLANLEKPINEYCMCVLNKIKKEHSEGPYSKMNMNMESFASECELLCDDYCKYPWK